MKPVYFPLCSYPRGIPVNTPVTTMDDTDTRILALITIIDRRYSTDQRNISKVIRSLMTLVDQIVAEKSGCPVSRLARSSRFAQLQETHKYKLAALAAVGSDLFSPEDGDLRTEYEKEIVRVMNVNASFSIALFTAEQDGYAPMYTIDGSISDAALFDAESGRILVKSQLDMDGYEKTKKVYGRFASHLYSAHAPPDGETLRIYVGDTPVNIPPPAPTSATLPAVIDQPGELYLQGIANAPGCFTFKFTFHLDTPLDGIDKITVHYEEGDIEVIWAHWRKQVSMTTTVAVSENGTLSYHMDAMQLIQAELLEAG